MLLLNASRHHRFRECSWVYEPNLPGAVIPVLNPLRICWWFKSTARITTGIVQTVGVRHRLSAVLTHDNVKGLMTNYIGMTFQPDQNSGLMQGSYQGFGVDCKASSRWIRHR